jgi:cytochrome c553|tara:strand:+ start:2896 stop:3519 length:624 start_codon:yes stop_codon:yes gene_type:complete
MIRIVQFISFIIISLSFAVGAESKLSSQELIATKKIINNLCIACHGIDGNSLISANPKLGGQHAAYILKQLKNFKSGLRENAVMAGMVVNLTEQEMINLALYFSEQNILLSKAKNNGVGSLGEKIFRAGIKNKGVAACAGCHGPSGHGIPDKYPRLNAQHSQYTLTQLNAFRLELRKNDSDEVMRTIAQKLTEQEMQAVADYIQGLR